MRTLRVSSLNARSTGVLPLRSSAFTFAPCFSNHLTLSSLPSFAAPKIGVSERSLPPGRCASRTGEPLRPGVARSNELSEASECDAARKNHDGETRPPMMFGCENLRPCALLRHWRSLRSASLKPTFHGFGRPASQRRVVQLFSTRTGAAAGCREAHSWLWRPAEASVGIIFARQEWRPSRYLLLEITAVMSATCSIYTRRIAHRISANVNCVSLCERSRRNSGEQD